MELHNFCSYLATRVSDQATPTTAIIGMYSATQVTNIVADKGVRSLDILLPFMYF